MYPAVSLETREFKTGLFPPYPPPPTSVPLVFNNSLLFLAYPIGDVRKINMTVVELLSRPPGGPRCGSICVLVKWKEVTIQADYRNVLFYTISYREA